MAFLIILLYFNCILTLIEGLPRAGAYQKQGSMQPFRGGGCRGAQISSKPRGPAMG